MFNKYFFFILAILLFCLPKLSAQIDTRSTLNVDLFIECDYTFCEGEEVAAFNDAYNQLEQLIIIFGNMQMEYRKHIMASNSCEITRIENFSRMIFRMRR